MKEKRWIRGREEHSERNDRDDVGGSGEEESYPNRDRQSMDDETCSEQVELMGWKHAYHDVPIRSFFALWIMSGPLEIDASLS